MEGHTQLFVNKLSYASVIVATLTLLLLYLRIPETCDDPPNPKPKPNARFPKSTCDFTHRRYVSLGSHNRRIWSTKTWTNTVSSYTSLFKSLQAQNYLTNHSRVLISSAGPGHGVQALNKLGVDDVTAVELVESPPLVSRGDPHNLPFSDGVFDLGLGMYLDRALFPRRYVEQIERTVRAGGICVVTVEECRKDEIQEIVKLFKKSRLMDAKGVILAGEKRTAIVMRVDSPS